MFERPGSLQVIAVEYDLVCLVTEHTEKVRVRVTRAEEPVHQRAPLDVVRRIGELRSIVVVRFEERRVIGVDDEDAHFETVGSYPRTLPSAISACARADAMNASRVAGIAKAPTVCVRSRSHESGVPRSLPTIVRSASKS